MPKQSLLFSNQYSVKPNNSDDPDKQDYSQSSHSYQGFPSTHRASSSIFRSGINHRINGIISGADKRWLSNSIDAEAHEHEAQLVKLKSRKDFTGIIMKYDVMKKMNIPITLVSYNFILEAFTELRTPNTPMTKPLEIYHEMNEQGFRPNLINHVLLIKNLCNRHVMLIEGGAECQEQLEQEDNLKKALELFYSTVGPQYYYDILTYDHLLKAISMTEDFNEAFRLLDILKANNIEYSQFTYAYLIKIHGKMKESENVESLFKQYVEKFTELNLDLSSDASLSLTFEYFFNYIIQNQPSMILPKLNHLIEKYDIVPSYTIFNNILEYYLINNFEAAKEFFGNMRNHPKYARPNKYTFSTMIRAYFNHKEYDNAIELYQFAKKTSKSLYFVAVDSVLKIALSKHDPQLIKEAFEDFDKFNLRAHPPIVDSYLSKMCTFMKQEDILHVFRLLIRMFNDPGRPGAYGASNRAAARTLVQSLVNNFKFNLNTLDSLIQILKEESARIDNDTALILIQVYNELKKDDQAFREQANSHFFEQICDVAANIKGNNSANIGTQILKDIEVYNIPQTRSLQDAISKKLLSSMNYEQGPDMRAAELSNEIVKNLYDITKARKLYETLKKEGFTPTPVALSQLLEHHGRLGMMSEAYQLVLDSQQFAEKNQNPAYRLALLSHVYNAYCVACFKQKDMISAKTYYDKIIDLGRYPSATANTEYLLCIDEPESAISTGIQMIRNMKSRGIRISTYFCNVFLSKLSRVNDYSRILEMVDYMKRQNIRLTGVSYATLMTTALRLAGYPEAMKFYTEYLHSKNIQRNRGPFHVMMGNCVATQRPREEALQFYDDMLKQNFSPTDYTYRILMEVYALIHPYDLPKARELFKEMLASGISPNIQHYHVFIRYYAFVEKNLEEAINWFDRLKNDGFQPDAFAYQTLIQAHINDGNTEMANRFRSLMHAEGLSEDSLISPMKSKPKEASPALSSSHSSTAI